MPWVTISIVLGIVMMLVVGVLIMYHTKAFWGLESNSNAATMNTTLNFASSTSIYPMVVIVVIALFIAVLYMSTARGFG